MNRGFARWSLRWQIATVSMSVVALFSLLIGLYLPARQAREAVELKRAALAGAAEMLALSVGVGLQLAEPSAVAAAFEWARRDPALRLVDVFDTEGERIATYDPESLVVEAARWRNVREVAEWGEYLVVSAPIKFQDQQLGDVVVAVTIAPIQVAARDDRLRALLVGVMLLLTGFGAASWVAGRIAGPVVELQRASERIAQGDYSTDVQIDAGKEVGALGKAFASMSSTLRRQVEALRRQAGELSEARDEALSATAAKSAFLASMSHEIRTPMSGVIGMLELLDQTPLTVEQREFAGTAAKSAEALLTIIDDILDFSKIEAGRLDLEETDLDVGATIEDVTALLADRASQHGIELVGAVDPEVPAALRGDPGRLRQILVNLAGNAIKFTRAGEVVIRVSVAERSAGDVLLRFEVRDTGIGIPPDVQTRLFQPFSQADSTTTRRFGGTGLGLAICRQLVTLMGGDIGVRSVVGVGSTFWFTTRLPTAKGRPLATLGGELTGIHALIVDDNPTNLRVLSEQLSSWGMLVRTADSGPNAVAMLRTAARDSTLPAVALLDLMMPGMDGFALADVLKGDPSMRGIPLVLLSSIGKRGLVGEAERHGIAATVVKPTRQRQLREALRAVVRPPAASPVPVSAPAAGESAQRTGPRLHVLLVEDNGVNQRVASTMLVALGHRVQLASNGLEALQAVGMQRFDVVLMDCNMPEMDGFEATAELRRLGHSAESLPIVALTANALLGDRERCLACGMTDYLSKPIRRPELAAALDRALSRSNTAACGSGVLGESAPSKAVDLAFLAELVGNEVSVLRSFLEDFDQTGTARIREATAGVEARDSAAVKRAAHTLRGVSAQVGANGLAALARQLEDLAADGSWERGEPVLARMRSEMEQVAAVTRGLQ